MELLEPEAALRRQPLQCNSTPEAELHLRAVSVQLRSNSRASGTTRFLVSGYSKQLLKRSS